MTELRHVLAEPRHQIGRHPRPIGCRLTEGGTHGAHAKKKPSRKRAGDVRLGEPYRAHQGHPTICCVFLRRFLVNPLTAVGYIPFSGGGEPVPGARASAALGVPWVANAPSWLSMDRFRRGCRRIANGGCRASEREQQVHPEKWDAPTAVRRRLNRRHAARSCGACGSRTARRAWSAR